MWSLSRKLSQRSNSGRGTQPSDMTASLSRTLPVTLCPNTPPAPFKIDDLTMADVELLQQLQTLNRSNNKNGSHSDYYIFDHIASDKIKAVLTTENDTDKNTALADLKQYLKIHYKSEQVSDLLKKMKPSDLKITNLDNDVLGNIFKKTPADQRFELLFNSQLFNNVLTDNKKSNSIFHSMVAKSDNLYDVEKMLKAAHPDHKNPVQLSDETINIIFNRMNLCRQNYRIKSAINDIKRAFSDPNDWTSANIDTHMSTWDYQEIGHLTLGWQLIKDTLATNNQVCNADILNELSKKVTPFSDYTKLQYVKNALIDLNNNFTEEQMRCLTQTSDSSINIKNIQSKQNLTEKQIDWLLGYQDKNINFALIESGRQLNDSQINTLLKYENPNVVQMLIDSNHFISDDATRGISDIVRKQLASSRNTNLSQSEWTAQKPLHRKTTKYPRETVKCTHANANSYDNTSNAVKIEIINNKKIYIPQPRINNSLYGHSDAVRIAIIKSGRHIPQDIQNHLFLSHNRDVVQAMCKKYFVSSYAQKILKETGTTINLFSIVRANLDKIPVIDA